MTFLAEDDGGCQTQNSVEIYYNSCSSILSTIGTCAPLTLHAQTTNALSGIYNYTYNLSFEGVLIESVSSVSDSIVFTSLAADSGSYSLEVINDSTGCLSNNILTLNPNPISIHIDTIIHVDAQGACNGSVIINILGGSVPYWIYWDTSGFVFDSAGPTNSDNDWIINKLKVYRICLEKISGGVQVTGQLRTGGTYEKVNSGDQNFYVTTGGGWYHVVLTFDGTNLVLYVNGDEKDTNSNSSYSTTNQNSEFSIGRRHDTGSLYYNGRIDEISFWNTGLSPNAVAALYNSGAGISASSNSGNYTSSGSLVFYLQMQQNLNDSENNYNFTGGNISSDDYEVTSFE